MFRLNVIAKMGSSGATTSGESETTSSGGGEIGTTTTTGGGAIGTTTSGSLSRPPALDLAQIKAPRVASRLELD